mmetsp:Transcript_54493/g.140282  ORF Transcript_54493/g.140282 Transcript_54493/m.140282 type:complete len:261 (+) Transcript_54493:580-1362(+)
MVELQRMPRRCLQSLEGAVLLDGALVQHPALQRSRIHLQQLGHILGLHVVLLHQLHLSPDPGGHHISEDVVHRLLLHDLGRRQGTLVLGAGSWKDVIAARLDPESRAVALPGHARGAVQAGEDQPGVLGARLLRVQQQWVPLGPKEGLAACALVAGFVLDADGYFAASPADHLEHGQVQSPEEVVLLELVLVPQLYTHLLVPERGDLKLDVEVEDGRHRPLDSLRSKDLRTASHHHVRVGAGGAEEVPVHGEELLGSDDA